MRLSTATLTFFGMVTSAISTPAMMRPAQYNNATTANADDRYRYDSDVQTLVAESMAGPNGKVNIGYFVNWGIYGRNFQPQDIDVTALTHILYAFADCDATTGVAKLTDTYADQEKHYATDSWSEPGTNLYGAMKQLYLLKKANRGLKTLLSFGGWTYSQSGHFNFVTNPSARATFISTAITLLEDNGFDGIDIDYEYPSSTEQGNGFAALIAELRTALDNHARNKGDVIPYLVTAAVGAGPTGYNTLPISQLNSALSFWNLMAYDYAGSWSTVSDDQANLYPGQTMTGFSTETALNYYLSHGASPNKVVMGIPLYGRAFTNTAGIRKPFSGVGPGSWENGVWDYKDLPRPGSTITEESDSVASYCYDAGAQTLVSYDTPNVVDKKAAYINSRGLAGGMFWELSNDKRGSESLVGTVARALGKLDTTQNHLNYPGSKFDNIRSQMGAMPPTTTSYISTSAPTTTVVVSTPPASSTNSSTVGGTCAGMAAWSSTAVYTAGIQVTYAGYLWQAKWWTQGETPRVYEGSPWNQLKSC